MKWETILGGVFLKKFLKKQKTPLNSSNREEKVVVKLLDCKLMCINYEKTVFSSMWEDSVLSGIFLKPQRINDWN